MGIEVRLGNTAELRNLLQSAAKREDIPQSVRESAICLAQQQQVDWRLLASVVQSLRRSGAHSKGPYLHQACQGGELLVASPSEREKSPELKARLAKLQKQLEAQQYAAMVKDITQKELDNAARAETSLVTYKDQLGFGVHVLVLMGSLYAVGHWLGRSISDKPVHHVMSGLVGLVLALLVEAWLYIIRTGYTPAPSVQAAHAQMQREALQRPGDKKTQ